MLLEGSRAVDFLDLVGAETILLVTVRFDDAVLQFCDDAVLRFTEQPPQADVELLLDALDLLWLCSRVGEEAV